MLTAKKFIGPSLRLSCQNHPDTFNDVANDSDFNTVPEGGCNRKCEYRLSCGHSCTLFCHPYDTVHKKFKCVKPCTKVCENGHSCQKKCFENCKPCPVVVEKVLSRCGHTVKAPCGEDELGIKCYEACKKLCKEGHQCPKKCFENCKSCPVVVEKVLSICGHTVRAPCGKNEFEIACLEACKKLCKEGHQCPKKCFESCGDCQIIVSKSLPKCNHTVQAACYIRKELIKCRNPCTKTCPRKHLCLKKCFEICGSCDVIIEKTLNSCGHTLMTKCGRNENEILCSSPCKRFLPCSHSCKNKCYEQCEKKCLQLVEICSPVCGHSFKVECCFVNDSNELARRCLEPCKQLLHCGHLCEGTCSSCKQGKKHILCKETCQKLLFCGHLCSNKCIEPCVVDCNKLIEISSYVCGHLLNIKCHLSKNAIELSKKCLTPCTENLPCGHTCRGSCGSCYNGRLHVSCSEICSRTLICGHKCEAKCSVSCPPCKKTCKNRCSHKRCTNKCGEPCVKCVKPCNWSCSHKKCSRRCYEVCDRDPCNEKCLKKLPCNHLCPGFCGEPCSKECFLCIENTLKNSSSNLIKERSFGYVYLEDCKHSLKEGDLRKWFTSNSSKPHEIKLKTCPKCGTFIRVNLRFNKMIKRSLSEVEEVKQMTAYDKNNNLSVQRNLLKKMNTSHSNFNYFYKSVINVLSGGYIRDIHELKNFESIMNIAKDVEVKNYGIYSMFALTPFHETLVIYARSCREWIIDFIGKNFFSVSEYQLKELSVEVYRLCLLDHLLKVAQHKHFASLSPEFEKCASSLMNFKPLTDENIEEFKRQAKNFLKNVPVKHLCLEEVANMSAQWYRCSADHIVCFSNYNETTKRKDCYKCRKMADVKKSSDLSSKTPVRVENYSRTLNDFDIYEALDERKTSISNGNVKNNVELFKKNGSNSAITKMRPAGKIANKHNSRFPRKICSDTQFARKSQSSSVPECSQTKHDVSRKNTEKRSYRKPSYQAKTNKKPTSSETKAESPTDEKGEKKASFRKK